MKVVILAGGFGTRLAEHTEVRPKPMVEVGGRPILWHILKHYTRFDHREFVVALGYKGEMIKRYFLDYQTLTGNLTVDLAAGTVNPADVEHREPSEDWKLHLIDTGQDVMTGGRLRQLRPLLDETFMLTYGDGVANVDLDALLAFHRRQGLLATVTAVRPPARFGGLVFEGDRIAQFTEKPQIGEGWINGGFMVFEPGVFDYLHGPQTILEADTLEALASDGQLAAYRHDDFWQCMDTKRELDLLQKLWNVGDAPWKTW
jgi:glucose-1-phosphate cytidylyltransferase